MLFHFLNELSNNTKHAKVSASFVRIVIHNLVRRPVEQKKKVWVNGRFQWILIRNELMLLGLIEVPSRWQTAGLALRRALSKKRACSERRLLETGLRRLCKGSQCLSSRFSRKTIHELLRMRLLSNLFHPVPRTHAADSQNGDAFQPELLSE